MKKEVKKNKTIENFKFYLSKIKEFLSNRRNKSLTILVIYILFFTIAFSFVDKDKVKQRYEDDNIQATHIKSASNLFRLNNYQFQYTITFLDTSDNPIKNFNINGKNYGGNTLLMIDETKQTYFLENNKMYIMNNGNYENVTGTIFDFAKLSPNNIYKYILKGEKELSTVYNEGYKKEVYKLTVKDFAKIYMNDNVENNNLVYINLYYYKNKIKAELNIGLYNNLKIDIEYTKLNKIKKFTKEDTLSM